MTSSVKNQRLVGRCGSLSLDPLLLQRLRDLLGLGGRVRLGSLGTLHGQLLGCVEVRDIVLESRGALTAEEGETGLGSVLELRRVPLARGWARGCTSPHWFPSAGYAACTCVTRTATHISCPAS